MKPPLNNFSFILMWKLQAEKYNHEHDQYSLAQRFERRQKAGRPRVGSAERTQRNAVSASILLRPSFVVSICPALLGQLVAFKETYVPATE